MCEKNRSIVCTYNEWDPLEEVIVGSVIGACKMAYEPSLAPFFNSDGSCQEFSGGKYNDDVLQKAESQLKAFVNILENEGIIVRRPSIMDYSIPYNTPDFSVPYGTSNTCPRDVLLVIGNEIIEAPMAQRSRFFEYRAYRSLLKEYFKSGAQWSVAPKPMMDNMLYEIKYSVKDEMFDADANNSLTNAEPCFDAASFVRFGRDIFYQLDTVTNGFGAKWLERHLRGDYRLHKIKFSNRKPPQHIDTTLVPISSNTILVNPERPCIDSSMELFVINGWNIVEAPASVRDVDHSFEVSNWISMNILCIDEERIIVEEAEEPLIRLLESLGHEVLTCPFDAVYQFGGSFHCCTADIRRRGGFQSYFPSLD